MKKVILSLFMVLSLLVAPIAHAGGVECKGDNCQVSEQSQKDFDKDNQDNDKLAQSTHHCCCPHTSAMPDLTVSAPMPAASRTVFTLEQDATTSVVVGPPLKPPSHA